MEGVIVGFPNKTEGINVQALQERENLIERLRKDGIFVETIDSLWPRDDFIYFSDKLFTRKEHGNYADGGYVRTYPNFAIACEDISKNTQSRQVDSPEERFHKLSSFYVNPVIIPNPNYTLNPELRPHSDLILFALPKQKKLFVDSLYLKEHPTNMNSLSEKLGLELIPVYNDYSNPSWPCNTLMLSLGNRNIAITNSCSNERFYSQLTKLGIDVIAVPFSVNCKMGGSVNCATNTLPIQEFSRLKEIL